MRPTGTGLALLLLVGATAAGATACGGSSSGPSATPPPVSPSSIVVGPSPVPSPQITSGTPPAGAVDVVREFWKVIGQGRLSEAQRFLTSPGSRIRDWTDTGVRDARVVGVADHSVASSPGSDATVEFAVNVWIRPTGSVTPWGSTGTHMLFERVVRMSDGTWRMVESGTGP